MIPIYTSFWGYIRNIPRNKYRIIQACSSRPKDIGSNEVNAVWKTVVPDYNELVLPLRNKQITHLQFREKYFEMLDKRKQAIKAEFKAFHSESLKYGLELVFIGWEGPKQMGHLQFLGQWFEKNWPGYFQHTYLSISPSGMYAPCNIHIVKRNGTRILPGADSDIRFLCLNPESFVRDQREIYGEHGYKMDQILSRNVDGKQVFLMQRFEKGNINVVISNADVNIHVGCRYLFTITRSAKKAVTVDNLRDYLTELQKQICAPNADARKTFKGGITYKETSNGKLAASGTFRNDSEEIKITTQPSKTRRGKTQVIIQRNYEYENTIEPARKPSEQVMIIRADKHDKGYEGNIYTSVDSMGREIIQGLFRRSYMSEDDYQVTECLTYGSIPKPSIEDLQKLSKQDIIDLPKITYRVPGTKQGGTMWSQRRVRTFMQDYDTYNAESSRRGSEKARIEREAEQYRQFAAKAESLDKRINSYKYEIEQLKTAKLNRTEKLQRIAEYNQKIVTLEGEKEKLLSKAFSMQNLTSDQREQAIQRKRAESQEWRQIPTEDNRDIWSRLEQQYTVTKSKSK